MCVTFAKDLGLTVVYLKIIFILVKSIGPAAAGPAGPVPAPLICDIAVNQIIIIHIYYFCMCTFLHEVLHNFYT